MVIDFLFDVFAQRGDADALIWNDRAYSYRQLSDLIANWTQRLEAESVSAGSVVAVEADFSPSSVALFLALVEARCVVVPLTSGIGAQRNDFLDIAQVELSITIDGSDETSFTRRESVADHEYYQTLRERGRPGLVLFSSGSTGKSKAAVHDLIDILAKFKAPRRCMRSITFLLYDHIGGVNTVLYNLSNGGCLVTVKDRDPDTVLAAIEKHKVELLPTSPTFINLILLSEAYKRYDLSSLKLVTYGTEPMPESTLKTFHRLFPEVQLLQTYGLSEVGILRSKSKSSDSLWVKLGGEGFETRVRNGMLEIKAQSAMLGYLNAPSPWSEDGWFLTGDEVEQDGEYFLIRGRKSEIINVGGEKVYPAEVESVIQELDNVADVTVRGEKNPITGQVVCATVTLREDEEPKVFKKRLKIFCKERLQPFKVPARIEIVAHAQHSNRFKRIRRKVEVEQSDA